mmetsp:Transcript_24319/g.49255  ORF Transcript_24319/g.49255 Transcript_24319/m.49255 type:complete len:80 (-) Transcript_24319:27-266(-)
MLLHLKREQWKLKPCFGGVLAQSHYRTALCPSQVRILFYRNSKTWVLTENNGDVRSTLIYRELVENITYKSPIHFWLGC